MIAEALNLMMDTGTKSASPIVKPDAEPPHVYYMRQLDGSFTRMIADLPATKRTALDLVTLATVANDNCAAPNPVPQIWYSPSSIVLLHGPRLASHVVLPLQHTPQFVSLQNFERNPSAMSQADIVRAFRVTFRGCAGPGETNLVSVLRKVDFKRTETTNGEVGHGRASLGKEIAGQVTGAGAIPEFVTLNVPVFQNPFARALRADIECALEPDPATGQFRLTPIPGQTGMAMELVMDEIHELIRAALNSHAPEVQEGISVHYGMAQA